MRNRLDRDLAALQDDLGEPGELRLPPERWAPFMSHLEELVEALGDRDQGRIGQLLQQLGASGARRVRARIDDPRDVNAPEPFRARLAELVPVIADRARSGTKPRVEPER
ncbi:CATRA system-associated protein [Plantactinospora solaniradicis]|uniref:CATRA system-associated protein n=1 Tax=Plantactinospora solaniradicis TaxID=1723736 RepID=A0ABW1KCH8_9ACTN